MFLARECIFKWLIPYPFDLILWIAEIRDIVDTMARIYAIFASIRALPGKIHYHSPPLGHKSLRIAGNLWLLVSCQRIENGFGSKAQGGYSCQFQEASSTAFQPSSPWARYGNSSSQALLPHNCDIDRKIRPCSNDNPCMYSEGS